MKVQLTSATDYAEWLQDVPGPVKPSLLATKMRDKYVQDFRYLRCNADGKLARFLDFITYPIIISPQTLLW